MWKNHKLLFNKKPIYDKLIEYGFVKREESYLFSTNIIDEMFCVTVSVSNTGITELTVIDNSSKEEYVLAYMEQTTGAFVGAVKNECEKILSDIVKTCFEPDIFKSDYAKQVILYMREQYGTEAEYLWEKFPNNALFREPTTQKWYAALLSVEKRKLGIEEDGTIEIIDLKETPEHVEQIVDGIHYLPGYHMNKKYWYTIKLDESVSIEEIYRRIDISFHSLSKSAKRKSVHR